MADAQPNYDDTDVELALASTDAGDDPEVELPATDFESFPEEGVENDHDGDNVVSEEEDGQ